MTKRQVSVIGSSFFCVIVMNLIIAVYSSEYNRVQGDIPHHFLHSRTLPDSLLGFLFFRGSPMGNLYLVQRLMHFHHIFIRPNCSYSPKEPGKAMCISNSSFKNERFGTGLWNQGSTASCISSQGIHSLGRDSVSTAVSW